MTQSANAYRLPGVYFLPSARVETRSLPPLDVTAFVGFAERGPLDFPVAVEDMDCYQSIFGGDLALAKEVDGESVLGLSNSPPDTTSRAQINNGRTVYANLPQSVAAFFANGGRRCYVVRVAGVNATATRIRVPGLVAVSEDGSVKPVFAYASSPGRWSSSLRLSSRLNATVLPNSKFSFNNLGQLNWESDSASSAVQPGDLLRMTINTGEYWLFPVSRITVKDTATVIIEAETVWREPGSEIGSPPVTIDLEQITTEKLSPVDSVSLVSFPDLVRIERLRFELIVMSDRDQYRNAIKDLAFNPLHPRFWGETVLLESSPSHRRRSFSGTVTSAVNSSLTANTVNSEISLAARAVNIYRMLQSDDRIERASGSIDPFLLSGFLAPVEADPQIAYLPIGMSPVYSLPVAPAPEDIGKDGLEKLEAGLFLDNYLVPTPHNIAAGATNSLMSAATDRYYIQNKRLRGMHSLAFIDEVAIVGIPDANHRGWLSATVPQVSPVGLKAAPKPVDPFSVCNPAPEVLFVEPSFGPVTGGTEVMVTGTGFMSNNAASIVESVSFDGLIGLELQVLSSTQLTCKTPVGGRSGTVTVKVDTQNGLGILESGFEYLWSATEPLLPQAAKIKEYDADQTLLPVHQALLNFCQARSDIVGILTLPAHFEKQHCIEWQKRFREKLGLPSYRSSFNDVRDLADLSYAAVYHPWLLSPDKTARDGLRQLSPEGIICGMIAAREHNRQVWVAPANVPIQGSVGVSTLFSEDDWADLYAAQINLIREEPRDIRVMSAHTLSDEHSLLQLSVRRLLIQLRKAAMEKGMDYAFANNYEHTRNAIGMALENLLRFMFAQGAFAGDTQSTSYRIVTDISVNPLQSIEQGRLIAQIQVAPSQPMEFITVLLNRTGDDMLQATEV
ncbi:MAG: IPT/TIG domain-containing protein [Methylococcaceae bacterium]|nr:IPT/TIG domain-containing protein [Methylococcaceae bacterium]